ncbi:hypothetical protein C2E23DRAFT_728919 [Lenzites betulinus]|nr:hypothetical protein C2E23DRAFT_728919 [Lenzites betulinus]
MPKFRKLGKTLRRGYARSETKMRGELRALMNKGLADVADVTCATMAYTVKNYCKKVVLRYRVKLVGWPDDIMFDNLSRITGKARVSRLLRLWMSGEMCFVPILDSAELDAARRDPLAVAPALMHRGLPPKRSRRDLGRRRHRPVSNPGNLPSRYSRNGPKSAEVVTEEAEARAEAAAGVSEVTDLQLLLLRLARRPFLWPELEE